MHAVVLSRLGIHADWTGIIQRIESSSEFDYPLRENQRSQNGQLCFLSKRSHTLSFLLFYTEHTASPLEAAVRNQYSPEPFQIGYTKLDIYYLSINCPAKHF